ncbi:glycosyl hydrolase 53 family protein [Cellulomonas denverensis]|uniref:glycosyl hydrolase 53 family protein n=1 Tax=Cellulomonas denverensis TaxID=264297 RepID=UPI0035E5B282
MACALAAALALGGTTMTAQAADGPVQAGITVPRVEGMGADWINGVDVSTVLSLEDSGVVFRDDDGRPADLFEVLADHGVNWARIRVWNDPFTAGGQGYGGGNVDAERAVEIGRRATAAGLRVLVDFHYSDFWAHPGQQQAPKAWRGLDLAGRITALHDYTADTLQSMADAGVDVGMVQIGNETTGGEIAGTTGWANTVQLFQAGSTAVRETLGSQVKVAVHFTNPERSGQYAAAAQALEDGGVDYDVFLSSYYPFWHGTPENLTAVLDQVATTYDKDVAVAETSWAYTLEDGDGYPNVISTEPTQYPATVQGQALAVRDVMQAVANVSGGRGLGTFYWEPAWLPVGPADQVEANRVLWDRDGSGWASPAAQEFYDPDGELGGVPADDYGGSGWDNQALFAHYGTPLESLRVYQYAVTGSVAPRQVDAVANPTLTVVDGDPITLPATVRVSYNDGTTEDQPVTWQGDTAWIQGAGTYRVSGVTSGGHATTATVTVLADAGEGRNLVVNPGFEDGVAPWTGTGTGYTISATDDPYAGSRSTHFWSATAYTFTVEQTVTGVPAGQYRLSARVQGGDSGPGDVTRITASSGISSVSADFRLSGYANWQHPQTEPLTVAADGVVVVSASFQLSAGAWGTLDEIELVAVPTTVAGDTAPLQALLDRAEAVQRAGYTPESLAALDAAAERARFVLAAPAPGQAAVDGAVAQLTGALGGLVPVTPEPSPEPDPEPEPEPGPDLGDTAATVMLSAGTVRPGDRVTVTLAGVPGTEAEVGIASVYQRLASVGLVDGAGVVTVTVPALDPGQHHVQVRDASGTLLAQAPITVLDPGGLAVTGARPGPLLAVIAVLLAAGATAVLLRRRLRA